MKTTRICIVTAAALTVGSISFMPAYAQVREEVPDTQRQMDNVGTDANRSDVNRTPTEIRRTTSDTKRDADGMAKKDYNKDKSDASMAPDAEGIRDVLAQVTQASLTTGGFDDLVERFVDADRNRIGRDGFAEQNQPELDRLAKSIGEAWKAKYNQDFNMDEEKVFSADFAKIKQSEVGRDGARGGAMLPGDQRGQTFDPNGNTNTRTDTSPNTGAEVTTRSDGTMTGPTGVQGGVDMTAAADQRLRNETGRTATPGTGAPDRTTGVDASRPASDIDGNRSVVTGDAAPDSATGRTAAQSTRTGMTDPPTAGGQARIGDDANRMGDDATRMRDDANRVGQDATANTAGDRNLDDAGRNTAVVTIPASHGLPELTVNLIHEFPGVWKIDVPEAVDGPRLQQNLIAHLNKVQQMQGQWPADVNEAYRAVSHHVLMAIHNMAPDMAASTD